MTSDYWKNNGIAGQRGTNKKAFAMLVMEALEALEKKQEHEQPDLVI